jgi:iron complex outermembrane receptor protein
MSARNFGALLFGTASLVALASAKPAVAQSDQPAASSGGGLEEIVVTARRREEKLQTVPIAITAFTAQALKNANIETASDLQHLVPALVTSQESRDEQAFFIRGQGPNGGFTGSPGVITYFAEAPFSGGGPGVYYDLANVQVLEGPQGTLFGRNTTGGAILFEPKKPTNDFEGYAQVSLGDYSRHDVEVALNVPIVGDKLVVRVAGNEAQRDGFTKDVTTGQELDNRDYWAGRVSVIFRPADNFENYTVYDSLYSHTNGTGIVLDLVNPNPATSTVQTFGLAAAEAALAEQQALGPRAVQTGVNDPGPIDKTYTYGITDIAQWDVTDDLKVKNIAAYRAIKNLIRYDGDGSLLPIVDVLNPSGWNLNYEQYTEELQLQGKSFADQLTWIAGGFLEFYHPAGYEQSVGGAATKIGGLVAPLTTTNDYLGQATLAPPGESSRSQALFAQGTYDLSALVDGLKFTAGARYSWDYKSDNYFQNVALTLPKAFGGSTINIPCDPCIVASKEFQALTWNFDLDYQITPDTLVYVTGRKGYKAGGFNPSGTLVGRSYQSEIVYDVELGLKSDWDIDGIKARTNVALFHDDYSNLQRDVGELVPLVPGGTPTVQSLIANGDATIEGLEVQGTVLPVKSVELTGLYSYIYARYDKLVFPLPLGGVSDLTALPYPLVPRNKFSLTGRYHLPIDDSLGDLSVAATYTYQTSVQLATGGFEPMGAQPAYGLLDLRVDWNDIAGEPFDASFFMTNVTDKLYQLGQYGIYSSTGIVSAVYGEPRMFGFQLKYHFGPDTAPAEAAAAAYVPPPVAAAAPAVPNSYLVFFDFNKSDLTSQAVTIVDQAAHNAGKVTQLEVTGHTDTVGSDAYNMRLSRRRAEAVAAQLEKDGIPSSEIQIVAKGKRDLLVPTADGVKEPQNRRVQIVYSEGPTS